MILLHLYSPGISVYCYTIQQIVCSWNVVQNCAWNLSEEVNKLRPTASKPHTASGLYSVRSGW